MIRMRTVLFFAVFIAVMVLAPDCAFARAGGGGGGSHYSHYGHSGRGDLIVMLVMLPVQMLYIFVSDFLFKSKKSDAAELLHRLEEIDPLWCESHIYARIEATFFAAQNAWTERNQDLAREFMSDRLYKKHKTQTDAMIHAQRRNVLENVNLIHADVIGVSQFSRNSNDNFYVRISGSMIDYHISTETGEIISGNPKIPEMFTEIWQFTRGDTDWLLNEIEQNPQLINITQYRCTSDAVGAGSQQT
jgi:hypothetical protein